MFQRFSDIFMTAPFLSLLLSINLFFGRVHSQTVVTLAGSSGGFNDASGTSAYFNYPHGVAADSNGNLYVADYYNNRIRKITPTGSVSTLAGSSWGSQDAVGTIARFAYPTGLAVDLDGNVYVSDYYNHRIRKITSTGTVSTLAGRSAGYNDATGTNAQFYYPMDVAVDTRNGGCIVYVADTYNHRIRRITSVGVVTTVAGSYYAGWLDGASGNARFYYPQGIAVDSSGNLYVGDTYNHRIRYINVNQQVVSTVAGNGNAGSIDSDATSSRFYYPRALVVDSASNVYVADAYNQKIRKYDPVTKRVSTFAGTSSAGALDGKVTVAQLYYPQGVTLDAQGNVYVADSSNNRIRKILNCRAGTMAMPTTLTCVSCAYGQFSSANNSDCANCAAGSFADVIGSTSCKQCAAGSFSLAGLSSCSLCPAGTSSTAGSGSCSTCPAGTYSSTAGSVSCITCDAGSYCVAGSTNPISCGANSGSVLGSRSADQCICFNGYYGTNGVCTKCPVNSNSLQPRTQSISNCVCNAKFYGSNGNCQSCPAGFSCPLNSTSPVPCPIGSYCPASSDVPILCEAGFNCPSMNMSAQLPCPIGSYCPGNGQNAISCGQNKTTASLSSTAASQCVCDKGFLFSRDIGRSGQCDPCPDNFYCPFIDDTMTPCPDDFFCLNGAPIACPNGTIRQGLDCKYCPIGNASLDHNKCEACPTGTYRPLETMPSCVDCPFGSICSSSAVINCAKGYAKSGDGCGRCSNGFFKGSVGLDQCTACQDGYYSSDDYSFCVLCPEGKFKNPGTGVCEICGAGQQPNMDRSACVTCPEGSYKPSSSLTCQACPKGATCTPTAFTCQAGFTKNNEGCTKCASGYAKPAAGNEPCDRCPIGKISNENDGRQTCRDCSPTFYRPDLTYDFCQLCPLNADCTTTSFTCRQGFKVNSEKSICARIIETNQTIDVLTTSTIIKDNSNTSASFLTNPVTYAAGAGILAFCVGSMVGVIALRKWKKREIQMFGDVRTRKTMMTTVTATKTTKGDSLNYDDIPLIAEDE